MIKSLINTFGLGVGNECACSGIPPWFGDEITRGATLLEQQQLTMHRTRLAFQWMQRDLREEEEMSFLQEKC